MKFLLSSGYPYAVLLVYHAAHLVSLLSFKYGVGEGTSGEENKVENDVVTNSSVSQTKESLPRVFLGIRIGIR